VRQDEEEKKLTGGAYIQKEKEREGKQFCKFDCGTVFSFIK